MNNICSPKGSENTSSGKSFFLLLFRHKVLAISAGIHEIGTLKWDLALCLLLAWLMVYFAIFKGIKWTGKVRIFVAQATDGISINCRCSITLMALPIQRGSDIIMQRGIC